MSQRLIVTVDADAIRVEDAFTHILDLFALVSPREAAGEDVFWRLVSVSKQSPLTVVAEAVAAKPDVDVDEVAKAQKARFSKNYDELRRGRLPTAWATGQTRNAASRVMRRSRAAVQRTRVILDDTRPDEDVVITESDAAIAEPVFHPVPTLLGPPKEQIGSIEGVFVQVGTHYNHPAILINERKSGRPVWCEISEDQRQQIASRANFEDVWAGHRVAVRGRLFYESPGLLSKIVATEIRRIEGVPIELDRIKDPTFTSGLSVQEYLERFSEGKLG